MSDANASTPESRPARPEDIEDAVVVEDTGSIQTPTYDSVVKETETVSVEPDGTVVDEVVIEEVAEPAAAEPVVVEVETVHATPNEPIVATTAPDAVRTEAPLPPLPGYDRQVVFVEQPTPPRKAGNRGIGSLLALASAVVFGALYIPVFALIVFLATGTVNFDFLTRLEFYIPVGLYAVGAVLMVLLLNRAGWALHILGSILVGVLVYLGTAGVIVLSQNIFAITSTEASTLFARGLVTPWVIAAGLLAREVALWSGALIARRGRKIKARNVEALDAWERDLAEKRAQGYPGY